MKETPRFSPPSISDCIDQKYQYTLATPYKYTYPVEYGESMSYTCNSGSPKEWTIPSGLCSDDLGNRTPRYSCITNHTVESDIPKFATVLDAYMYRTCYAGTLNIDGKIIQNPQRTCITTDSE
jgi:hypothetical protein